jgi:hypothetical protein
MAHEANAILAISSTDRYIASTGGNVNQPFSNTLLAQYVGANLYDGVQFNPPSSSDFSIIAPSALINGYIEKIIISQIQLQYNVPTIIPGRNDIFEIAIETGVGTGVYTNEGGSIPYGYYTPQELAAMLEVQLDATVYAAANDIHFTVTYNMASDTNSSVGFQVEVDENRRFYFTSPIDPLSLYFPNTPGSEIILKTYKVFGFTFGNADPQFNQVSTTTPQFLYTPYIDIYSDALTNYQKLKDTDSSTSRRKGLIARLYLSGVGSPQPSYSRPETLVFNAAFLYNGEDITGTMTTTLQNTDSLGSAPFFLTYDLNSPKVVKWTKDSAINSLDFQLRDCYGDLLWASGASTSASVPGYGGEIFNTEFQMTLLCVEGDE